MRHRLSSVRDVLPVSASVLTPSKVETAAKSLAYHSTLQCRARGLTRACSTSSGQAYGPELHLSRLAKFLTRGPKKRLSARAQILPNSIDLRPPGWPRAEFRRGHHRIPSHTPPI